MEGVSSSLEIRRQTGGNEERCHRSLRSREWRKAYLECEDSKEIVKAREALDIGLETIKTIPSAKWKSVSVGGRLVMG